jgi:hypothetical protein
MGEEKQQQDLLGWSCQAKPAGEHMESVAKSVGGGDYALRDVQRTGQRCVLAEVVVEMRTKAISTKGSPPSDLHPTFKCG